MNNIKIKNISEADEYIKAEVFIDDNKYCFIFTRNCKTSVLTFVGPDSDENLIAFLNTLSDDKVDYLIAEIEHMFAIEYLKLY